MIFFTRKITKGYRDNQKIQKKGYCNKRFLTKSGYYDKRFRSIVAKIASGLMLNFV